jgi:anti-sigma factor RsiW
MNGHPTNEEREALIAAEAAKSLAPGEADELSLLAGLLGDPSTWAEPGAGLEDAIVAAVEQAPAAAARESVPARADAARRESPSRRRRVGWLAAPAAAAIAAVIAIGALTGGGSGADFSGNLAAGPAAPAARATASVTKNQAGFRVVLDAHGLPKLPAGQYYQAWLKDAHGTLVPIGTFSSSDGRVTLWSGVSPKDFNLISVTLEAADGDQASSGRKVLIGEVHP